jgi:xanthine/uracil permease
MRYGLDERPPLRELMVFGLQWLAVSVPSIVIIGRIIGSLQCPGPSGETLYLQKISFVTGATLLAQLAFGHRLPLVVGPSSVLLVGLLASLTCSLHAIYSALMVGGAALTAAALTGVFGRLRKLFSPRVVAVVLLLVAFTLLPTILKLIAGPAEGASAPQRLLFASGLVLATFAAGRYLRGMWGAALVLLATVAGSFAYAGLFGVAGLAAEQRTWFSGFFTDMTVPPTIEWGVLFSFVVCFVGLAVNDLGSIQSLQELLRPDAMERRISRGIMVTGMGNVLAGFLGTLGPVNYSLSPGVILSSGCGSRHALVPAGIVLVVIAFSPVLMGVVGLIPAAVIGSVLFYILCYQVAAGLITVTRTQTLDQVTGLVVGLPVLAGTMAAFMPAEAIASLPAVVRSLAGNGFVVGIVFAFILEHGVFRRKH